MWMFDEVKLQGDCIAINKGVGEPVFWGEFCRGNSQGKKGDLGVLTRQLTSQEYTKRIVTGSERPSDQALFVFPKIIHREEIHNEKEHIPSPARFDCYS
jgi:hypothetical protein